MGGYVHHGDKKLTTFQCEHVIDVQAEHYVSNFTGTRWSIALYLHPRVMELKLSDQEFLASVGFCLPDDSDREDKVSAPTCESRLESGDGRLHLLEISVPLNVVATVPAEKSQLAQHMSIDEGADVLEVSSKQCPDACVISLLEAWETDNLQRFADRTRKDVTVVSLHLCGDDFDGDNIAMLEAVLDCRPSAKRVYLVTALEKAMPHFGHISELLASMPFVLELSDFSVLDAKLFIWSTGDVEWPKGTRNPGYAADALAIRPRAVCKDLVQSCLLRGWQCENKKGLGENLLFSEIITDPKNR